ncbi:MAG TPA: hypothetical protein VJR58_17905 [Vineibacter sp.]|nr:hypothetical protein [Vineibacter sp.]
MLAATAIALGIASAAQAEPGRVPGTQLAQQTPPATPPADKPADKPAEKPAGKLTGMAAWSTLVGNTVVGKIEGKDFADYYLADGTVKSMVESQIATGKWALEGDKICFVYPDEPRECYAMEVVGDDVAFTDNTGAGIRAKVLKGNAKNF